MKITILLVVMAFTACASVTRESGIERVRFVGTTPQGCHFVGEIQGSYRGDSVSGGIVSQPAAFTEIDFKNNVVRAGGNTVELRQKAEDLMVGEAYRCDDL